MSDKQVKLSKDEQALEEQLSRGEWVSNESKESRRMWKEAIANYKELEATKRITMRVKTSDLVKVKAKAKKASMPYQTLLKLLIKRFADGEVSVEI